MDTPLVEKLEKAWHGCGWIEVVDGFEPEPLGPTPTLGTLDTWKRERDLRTKRVQAAAERFFRNNPDEFQRVLQEGLQCKKADVLNLI